MNDVIPPESFSEFGGLWLFYVVSWGLVTTLLVFLVVAFGLTIFSFVARQLPKLGSRLARFGVLLLILLPVGGLFSALWSCLVSGNLYVAHDVDSPEDDFSPFLPINQTWLDEQHGHTLSISLASLQLVWLLFAASAWAISFIVYRLLRTKLLPAVAAPRTQLVAA